MIGRLCRIEAMARKKALPGGLTELPKRQAGADMADLLRFNYAKR